MDLHRVRRLSEVLVVSQLRSGRSTSDPKSFLGRPVLLAVVDVAAFLVAFSLAEFVLASARLPAATLAAVANQIVPYFPLLSASVVLVAGVMFELTATAKFSGSDAANWLPLTAAEYVAASASAIAYTYSFGVAVILGGLLSIALAAGTMSTFALTAALSVLALFEGALLVEMVRSVSQRAGSVRLGRGGRLTLVLRALVLAVVILAIQLLVNPVFLFASLHALSSVAYASALVPFLWSTEALLLWTQGAVLVALAYALGQVLFVAALLYAAARLRVRFWVPSAVEVRFEPRRSPSGHRGLAALGLAPNEAALVAKDLRGLTRRREMLPMLVLPIVLVVLVFVEGPFLGAEGSVVWVGWAAGFFALLVSATSVGQERRSLQFLYALPIAPRNVARAKVVAVLLPALLVAAGVSVLVGLVVHLAPVAVGGTVLLAGGATVALALWGLVFAARFSDFQDRPRPQYLRPAAMLAAMGSGMVVLFAIVVPGALVIAQPSVDPAIRIGLALATVVVSSVTAAHWVRTGFDRLFRELPV